jgi:hypothetical protein
VCVKISGGVSVGVKGIVWPLGVYYGWWGVRSVSKILLGEIVDSSFRWLPFVYSV